MLQRAVGLIVILVLLSTRTAVAQDIDFLEIVIDRYESKGGGVLHDVLVSAGKDGATTCELVTSAGTYSYIDMGGSFQPQQDFIDDHKGMSFSGLEAVISTDWTMTWDAGLAQTVVNITFGAVLENDFLPLPTITAPIDGVPIENPRDPNPPTFEWTYSTSSSSCDGQYIVLGDQVGTLFTLEAFEVSCSNTSWTPSLPLTEGTWFFLVGRATDYRDVPVGIDIVEGTWPLENSQWLALLSSDRSLNDVVPTRSTSWGTIKALY